MCEDLGRVTSGKGSLPSSEAFTRMAVLRHEAAARVGAETRRRPLLALDDRFMHDRTFT
jgi:hypothetical protein